MRSPPPGRARARWRVDDGLGPGERLVETLAADHVDTLGARDRDHIVSTLLEDLDEGRSDSAGGSGDGNLLAPVFGLHGPSFPSAGGSAPALLMSSASAPHPKTNGSGSIRQHATPQSC